MSASVGLFGSVNSVSALRSGFASLQPISVRETIRKFGLKITTIKWQFETTQYGGDLIKNYPTYVTFLNDSVMQKVKLPSTIDPKSIAKLLTERALEEFNEDHELKAALSAAEKEKESTRPFLEFAHFLRKRFNEERIKVIQSKAEMFSNSNLPFSFFTNLVMWNEIEEGFLDVVERKLNLYGSVWLRKSTADPRLSRTKFKEMKDSLAPLFDAMEFSSFVQRCLYVLILASNCDDANSLFSVKFIDLKKVDYEQFERFSAEFESSLDNCTSIILRMEPNSFSKLPTTDLNRVFSQILV